MRVENANQSPTVSSVLRQWANLIENTSMGVVETKSQPAGVKSGDLVLDLLINLFAGFTIVAVMGTLSIVVQRFSENIKDEDVLIINGTRIPLADILSKSDEVRKAMEKSHEPESKP